MHQENAETVLWREERFESDTGGRRDELLRKMKMEKNVEHANAAAASPKPNSFPKLNNISKP